MRLDARLQRQGRGLEQRLLAVVARDHFAEGALLVNGDTVHPVGSRRPCCAARGPPASCSPSTTEKKLAEEEMKIALDADGPAAADHQADGPADGVRRVHRRHADRGRAARRRSPTRWRRPGGATPTSTTRTATRSSSTAAAIVRCGPDRRRQPGSRSTTTPTSPGRGRSRATTSPRCWPARSSVDIRRGAVERPPRAAGRTGGISPHGQGRASPSAPAGRGDRRAHRARRWPTPTCSPVDGGSLDAAAELQTALGERGYDAVVGDRRRPDPGRREVRRDAGRACRWSRSPRTWPTTESASPVASSTHDGGKGSYGVALPLGGGRRPRLRARARRRAGARRRRGRGEQPVGDRGLAARRTRSAASRSTAWRWPSPARRAEAVLHRPDAIDSDELPRRAGRGAGAVRDGDGGRGHQPAVQRRLPRDLCTPIDAALPRHGQPRRAGGLGAAVRRLPARRRGLAAAARHCLRRHGLPACRRTSG